MEIKQVTGTANLTKLARKPTYIVLHYTAGVTSKQGSATNTAKYFANPSAKASADFIVDDVDIVQYNPAVNNYYCWAVGGGRQQSIGGSLYQVARNCNSVSIEMCSTNKTGKMTKPNEANYYFTDAVINNAVDLTRYLMSAYGIDADHVIRHFDCNGKACPGVVGWGTDGGYDASWQNFKSRLSGNTAATVTETKQTETASGSYLVRVTAYVLNVRTEPNTKCTIATSIKKGEVYTIVEENNGWGKLKSGAGWICLKYTERV